MLQIDVPGGEFFNNETQEFVYTKAQRLQLEHSLVSISKWEARWKKPFFGKQSKTDLENLDYVRCMTITQNVDPLVYLNLSAENLQQIHDYISDDMTATTFPNDHSRPSREIVTSELIYYWMVAFNIPWECEKWHINRLITLIRICGIKNGPQKKMSRNEIIARNAELNAARCKALHTKG